jgi:glycopeptide antibiotics resistance protein
MYMLVSLTWFISVLPFVILLQIIMASQSKKNNFKIPQLHIVAGYIFAYLLTVMLGITGISSIRDIFLNSYGIITPQGLNIPLNEINLIPFYRISKNVRPYIENIVLFIPFGFLLPCIWKKYEMVWKTVLSGFIFSLMIEFSQLFNRRVTDIDDLLMNTLGALIGWIIFKLLQRYLHGFRKKISIQSTNNEILTLLFRQEACFYMIIAFAGIFFIYYPLF